MKYVLVLLGIGIVGYYGYTKFQQQAASQKAAAEAPPPPPPVIEMPPPTVLDEEQLERVKAATGDADPQVRWEAFQLLSTSQDPRAEEIMLTMLHRDPDSGIRRNIINLLSMRKGPQITENLVVMLKDMEPEVRLAALDALGKVGDPTAAPAISDAMRDIDERVRLAALRVLKSMQEKRNQDVTEKRKQQEALMRQHEEMLRQQAEQQKK